MGKTAHPGTGPNARTCRLLGSPLRWARTREEGGGAERQSRTQPSGGFRRWVQEVGSPPRSAREAAKCATAIRMHPKHTHHVSNTHNRRLTCPCDGLAWGDPCKAGHEALPQGSEALPRQATEHTHTHTHTHTHMCIHITTLTLLCIPNTHMCIHIIRITPTPQPEVREGSDQTTGVGSIEHCEL